MDIRIQCILLLTFLGWIGSNNGINVEKYNGRNRFLKRRLLDSEEKTSHVVKRSIYANPKNMYHCLPGAPPVLTHTSGNVVISEDNQRGLVGGYGPSENIVRYGVDLERVSTFTIYSRLSQGSDTVCNSWFYVTSNGERVPIENSPVAGYARIANKHLYNLVFTRISEAIQGSYLIVARNAYGEDTQLTRIGILPELDKSLSGIVTGSEASLGQTLVARFGAELRINAFLREWTLPWSFRWYFGGIELQGHAYSFQTQGTEATLIIHKFQSSDIREYTAVVSNRNGQDNHTFNLMAETVVSCANNANDASTSCGNCPVDVETEESTLTIYGHSFPRDLTLLWYRVHSTTGERRLVKIGFVESANNLIVPVSSLCDFTYQVVVSGHDSYTFVCECALPLLEYTSGNFTINQNDRKALVGGYGASEGEVNYGLDGDWSNTFTLYSSLTGGTEPVAITWYHVTTQGERILVEHSAVANYVRVSRINPYNLIFSRVTQGSFLIIAENVYGTDRQLTHIGILPKWDKSNTGVGSVLGQTVVANFRSELAVTGTVREGTKPWSFNWYFRGVELVQGQDYSFQYQGNQATIIIHSYHQNDIGGYMAVVSNRYGHDSHTFNLMAGTVVSCNNNPNDLSTTCTDCQSNVYSSTLTVYAHSFPHNLKLTWYRVHRVSGLKEQISESTVVNGANSIAVSVSSLCVYKYEVVVTDHRTYTFNCPCNNCGNETFLRSAICGDDSFADILLLIDVSASMDTEHAFLREFLPRFERSLQQNCVGNGTTNKNQYTAVAFGSEQGENKEYPYFVGPNLNRGDSTQNVYFTIDVDNPINVTNTINQLPTRGEREDGLAATNFAVKYAQLRNGSIRFAILITDEAREFFYRTIQEIEESSTLYNNFTDLGRSLYTDLLLDNNIIPIQIIDIQISTGNTTCLGVSSAETCFYRDPISDEIRRLENVEVVNTAGTQLLRNIHRDYLQPALLARGYAWDLKVISENETGNWDAITTAITNEVIVRAREELTQCRRCRCLPGGMQCQIVSVSEQASCKCEKRYPDNEPYCSCITSEFPEYCFCRYIFGSDDEACRETGIIEQI